MTGIAFIIILIIALWMTGVILKMIGKRTAMSYVKENYSEIDLTYQIPSFQLCMETILSAFLMQKVILIISD